MNSFHYSLILFLFGLLLFSPVFSLGFALDDFKQVIHNPAIQHLQHIPTFFTKSFIFQQGLTDPTNYFYRPLFYSVYTVLYAVGHGNSFPFHLFQVFLYLVNVLLVFFFFTKIFSKPIAFLLASLFLIHPDNEEVVAYIADLQDCLFFFFGMLALLLVQKGEKNDWKTMVGTGILLLCACLSKETGILFVILIPILLFCIKKPLYKAYIVVSAITLGMYGVLRLYASRIFFSAMSHSYLHGSSYLHNRIAMIPQVITYQLKDFFVPFPNLPFGAIFSVPLRITISTIVLAAIAIVFCGFMVQKIKPKLTYYFVFFGIWFLLGIIFHSQIIPLDVPVAKRWLYFSMVGMLGMIGILGNMCQEKIPSTKYLLIALYCTYLLFFSFETTLMNHYWPVMSRNNVHTVMTKYHKL